MPEDTAGPTSAPAQLEQATAEFRAVDGTYTFPMACRLFWGSKQA